MLVHYSSREYRAVLPEYYRFAELLAGHPTRCAFAQAWRHAAVARGFTYIAVAYSASLHPATSNRKLPCPALTASEAFALALLPRRNGRPSEARAMLAEARRRHALDLLTK